MYRMAIGRFGMRSLYLATTTIACASCSSGDHNSASTSSGAGAAGVSGASTLPPGSGGASSGSGGSPGTGNGGAASGAGGTASPASGGGSNGAGAAGASGSGTVGTTPDGGADASDVDGGSYTGPKTNYPGRRWTVPDPSYDMVVDSNVKITMSDGIVLVGDVAYPADLGTSNRAKGDFPVLLTQNPYGSVYQASSGQFFVQRGYIYASVDVRGTSRSGGKFDLFGPREADDGAELVTWASKLAGSDGKVGLHGCSQLGINQIETLTRLGPSSPVKASIPACASGDFFRDTVTDNGIPSTAGAAIIALLGNNDLTTGGDATYYRDFWKERDRLARAPAIAATGVPMLLWAGWHEPGSIGSLELYVALQNLAAGRAESSQIEDGDTVSGKYQVILGDWGHAGGLDYGIQLEWYDTWIKGIRTGMPTTTKTPLHLEELGGTNRWLNARNYPLVDTYTPLYLSSGGKLGKSADATAGQDQLLWAPDGALGGSIEYQTDPFTDGGMLAGPIAVRLQASSSNANLQFSVDVYDKAANGTRTKITHGSILGSLRALRTQASDPGTSWTDKNGLPTRPYLKLDQDETLSAGAPAQLDVPLWPAVWSIERGHSIVLRIATAPPAADCGGLIALPVGCNLTDPQKNSLTGGIYKINRGGKSSSFISLPLLAHGSLTTAEAVVSATGIKGTPLPVDW